MNNGNYIDIEMGNILLGLIPFEQLGPCGPFITNICKYPVYIVGYELLIVSKACNLKV
jgi:hypothetical protein